MSPRNFVFVTSNPLWGGSELLWSLTAIELARRRHKVSVFIVERSDGEPVLARLEALGCRIVELDNLAPLPRRLVNRIRGLMPHAMLRTRDFVLSGKLRKHVGKALVVISQGGNIDGGRFASVCRRQGLPYAMVAHKAQETIWPQDGMLDELRAAYSQARWSFFVSESNRRLTENQLGMSIERASVVRNPFLVPWSGRDDWPDEAGGLRLACVGRLYPFDKGQDLLLRVLARTKWKERPISVTFFGSGNFRETLQGMASHLGVRNVSFAGHAEPASIWTDHHALILPSRGEGLPLVLVEAMLSGRVPIVTDVAGNGEVVDDNRTGFVAAAPTEDALDEALERAWNARAHWRGIGEEAARSIRLLVPEDPPAVFADRLLQLTAETS